MAMQNPYSKYANNAIFTATGEELVLMLYDGALKFCNKAIVALERKEIENTHINIVKVQNIIREFQIGLDPQYGISEELNAVYDMIHSYLVDANIKKDLTLLQEATDMIRSMRDNWKEAMVLARK